ncbi:hypothetical protein PGPR2_08825 [Pseudomonas aeruginosa PGPR2]|nr:hypothetical protein PGPR2_08825 [Pseudomonas aeruginosa PGPR2]
MDEELNRAASLAIELADVDSAARLHERKRAEFGKILR